IGLSISDRKSITRVKCRKLKFLININIFRALCRESKRRSRRKDGCFLGWEYSVDDEKKHAVYDGGGAAYWMSVKI
ncbi:unnamed protein product, partial [Porites evermanni]